MNIWIWLISIADLTNNVRRVGMQPAEIGNDSVLQQDKWICMGSQVPFEWQELGGRALNEALSKCKYTMGMISQWCHSEQSTASGWCLLLFTSWLWTGELVLGKVINQAVKKKAVFRERIRKWGQRQCSVNNVVNTWGFPKS